MLECTTCISEELMAHTMQGFIWGQMFGGGTYTSVYMYVCIYTHALLSAAWRGASMMLFIQ